MKIQIEYIEIDKLKKYDKNPRKNQRAIPIVKKSIEQFGFKNPIIIDKDNTIIAGHTRLEAAKELEYKEVPVIYANDLTKEQINAFRIMDNKSQEYALWDEDILNEELKELSKSGFDLDYTGFKESEIQKKDLFDTIEEKPIDLEKEPKYKVNFGDLYKLGEHLLLCGDSTDENQIKCLFKNEKARMVFTDPPYGVSYKGTNNPNGREWQVIEGDNLRGDALYQLINKSAEIMNKVTIENPAIYVFYASINHIIFENALNDAGFKIKQQLIWDKHHILGHSDYHWNHEPILYCIKEGHNSEWFGLRDQKTIIERTKKMEDLTKLKKEELMDILTEIFENSTIWKIKKDNSTEYIHPTQKPFSIAQKAIINSSKVGEIVFEPFAGSGSTLIACEVTKRKCRAVELDTKYASAILERYENYTGIKPIKIN